MLRTAGLLLFLPKSLSAGFDDRISPTAAALLLGGWDLTETGLAPASRTRLLWTHQLNGPERLATLMRRRQDESAGRRLRRLTPRAGLSTSSDRIPQVAL